MPAARPSTRSRRKVDDYSEDYSDYYSDEYTRSGRTVSRSVSSSRTFSIGHNRRELSRGFVQTLTFQSFDEARTLEKSALAVWHSCTSTRKMMIAQPTPIRIAELIGNEVGFGLPDAREAAKVLPSVGSVMHELGNCKPCAWFWKQQGCKNGRECLHCHLCSSTEVRHRKKQRALAKRISFRPPPGLSISSEPDSPVSVNTQQSSRSSSLGSPDPMVHTLSERTVLLKSLHAMHGPNRRNP
eukprot:s424_g3.t1